MRRAPWIAALATIGLALPFTLLALAGAAWLTENLTQMASSIGGMDLPAAVREAWSRWPEILGMVIGMGLVVVILVLAKRELAATSKESL
ncbi:MAG TPA: hypothetical protein VFI11_02140 [Anaerolineales bacterium]|nr:hypothetical protein [Anaerolineales bacterium]